MPLVKTTGIILKSRKWGEADRIVTFYTKHFGKIRGVARGARRLKSRFGAALEPFTLCHLNLFEKPGDSLFRVSHVDLVTSFQSLREDLTLMASAARMVNVVTAVTPDGDPDGALFDTLEQGLASLSRSQDPTFTALLFQIRLLGLTGFRPQTDHCAACGKTRLVGDPHFSPLAGGLVCLTCASRQRARCVALSRGSLSFLQQAIRLAPALVTRLKATGQVRNEIEEAIEGYVTVVAGKRLPPVDFLSPPLMA
ncbi:DNA repair protein RecO [Nitrospira moscoviensis]|uniref:DNA repair protein RecO n=1 Tax=Nitrospira moscoviensis TaxID=42253 RepID=A0A0K2GFT7_NITMO|nr:DNA repair protein RecO [Nitrospira moscoviensis]ALA59816.1 DNA repair protein RecO [Nitrospira moscoviensis]